jgi:hypothetical protein
VSLIFDLTTEDFDEIVALVQLRWSDLSTNAGLIEDLGEGETALAYALYAHYGVVGLEEMLARA